MLERKISLFERFSGEIGINNEWYNEMYLEDLEFIIDNKIDSFDKLDIISTTKEGYKIVKSTSDLAKAGAPIACSIEIKTNDSVDKYIVIDDLFFKLSSMSRKFVLTHEIAHLKFNHLDAIEGGMLDDITKEIEADSLAVDLFGKESAILALEEVTRLVISIIQEENIDVVKYLCEVMETRIEAIRNR